MSSRERSRGSSAHPSISLKVTRSLIEDIDELVASGWFINRSEAMRIILSSVTYLGDPLRILVTPDPLVTRDHDDELVGVSIYLPHYLLKFMETMASSLADREDDNSSSRSSLIRRMIHSTIKELKQKREEGKDPLSTFSMETRVGF